MKKGKFIDTQDLTVIEYKKTEKIAYKKSPPPTEDLTISLTVIHSTNVDFGKHFNFSQGPIYIGRSDKSQIFINDPRVSKKHCEVSLIRDKGFDQVLIKDLKSTNGTFVNEEEIEEGLLKPGDKIRVGDTVLRLNYNDKIEDEYHSKLFKFAAVDSLTGLYNRRYILNELSNQCKIAERNDRIFSLIIIDIDNFKHINDTFGHLIGDEILKKMAEIMSKDLRGQDICGRFGGEEFLYILPETKMKGAIILAERLRKKVEKAEMTHKGNPIRITISAGISQFGMSAGDPQSLFKAADLALQKAKRAGKNRVIVAESS